MTTPQQQPERFESTERTSASAQDVGAARAGGSGTDMSYPAEGYPAESGRGSAQNYDEGRQPGSSYEGHHAADPTDPSTTERATEHRDTATMTGAAAGSSTTGAESSAPHTAAGSGGSLFGEQEQSNLRARWADVQAAFVDDPRECVQKADRLVADLVDHLTAGFSEARSQLEGQWARGEEVSTENLRVALQRYRDFFDRLLAV
jgi:hypothetical protein